MKAKGEREEENRKDVVGLRRVTVMIGGDDSLPNYVNVDSEDVTDQDLVAIARDHLKRHISFHEDPVVTFIGRCRKALPIYEIGHQQRVAEIEEFLLSHSLPLSLLGPLLGKGVGVNDSIASAKSSAHSYALRS
jgi:protoporphyrinogen oxidase